MVRCGAIRREFRSDEGDPSLEVDDDPNPGRIVEDMPTKKNDEVYRVNTIPAVWF